MSPAAGEGSPGEAEGTGAVLSPGVTPALLARKSWSSSWTVLEGGILTFFKDSKHSTAGALVRAPRASVGPAPRGRGSTHGVGLPSMGWGQNPWDGVSTHGTGSAPTGWHRHTWNEASTHGTGQHPWDGARTHGAGQGPTGQAQHPWDRASPHGEGSAPIGWAQHPWDWPSSGLGPRAPVRARSRLLCGTRTGAAVGVSGQAGRKRSLTQRHPCTRQRPAPGSARHPPPGSRSCRGSCNTLRCCQRGKGPTGCGGAQRWPHRWDRGGALGTAGMGRDLGEHLKPGA